MNPGICHPTPYSVFSQSEQYMWVLCKPDFELGTFVPVFSLKDFGLAKTDMPSQPVSSLTSPTPPDTKQKPRNNTWSETEDAQLYNYVTSHGVHSWAKIAMIINQEMHDGANVRLGKHCRERWYNHLNPDLNSSCYSENEWAAEEDLRLVKLQMDTGNCWSKIAREMSGRTENSVKNRWNSLIKKARSTMKLHHDSVSSVARKLYKLLEAEFVDRKTEEA